MVMSLTEESASFCLTAKRRGLAIALLCKTQISMERNLNFDSGTLVKDD